MPSTGAEGPSTSPFFPEVEIGHMTKGQPIGCSCLRPQHLTCRDKQITQCVAFRAEKPRQGGVRGGGRESRQQWGPLATVAATQQGVPVIHSCVGCLISLGSHLFVKPNSLTFSLSSELVIIYLSSWFLSLTFNHMTDDIFTNASTPLLLCHSSHLSANSNFCLLTLSPFLLPYSDFGSVPGKKIILQTGIKVPSVTSAIVLLRTLGLLPQPPKQLLQFLDPSSPSIVSCPSSPKYYFQQTIQSSASQRKSSPGDINATE